MKNWAELYKLASELAKNEIWNEAADLLDAVCRIVPEHASAHHLLGKAKHRQGQLAEAEAHQRRSCELDPDLGWNWFALAELQEDQQRWGEAARHYRRASQALPREGWIQPLAIKAEHHRLLSGEDLTDGLQSKTYQFWCEQLEPRLPSDLTTVQQTWLIHTHSGEKCGDLPVQGWLIVLGSGCRLRNRAEQTLEAWLSNWGLEQPDLITADEDIISESGERSDPWFKPGELAESSWSTPWLESFSAWRCSWLREQSMSWPPCNPLDQFRWLLQALRAKPKHQHAPVILVHQRQQAESKASREAKAELLKAHLKACGENIADIYPHPKKSEGYQLQWAQPKNTRCSVIVPTKDRADILEACLSSVTATTSSGCIDVDWIVIDNDSTEPELMKLLQQWKARLGSRMQILHAPEEFNWSSLNNKGAQLSSSDLLLFLNNDIEALYTGWLEAMATQALRDSIGCVGAVLLYPDGTLQHAGVVVGMHYGADHAYRGFPVNNTVHRSRSSFLSDWGAVTGACMMVRRDLFERTGGFDPALPVEFNDVDFCLRLGQLGYRHVIDPASILIHHESQSRDAHNSSTASAAVALMQSRWQARMFSTTPWWPQACAPHCSDGRPRELENI